MTDAGQIIATQEPHPAIHYVSGLSIFHEELIAGRLVGCYFSATGFAEREDPHRIHRDWPDGPLVSFALETNGQSLHYGWRFVDVRESPPADRGPSRHSILTLANELREVAVDVHMKTDGTGFFERWLDIANTGNAPLALGSVWPWSGLLMMASRPGTADRNCPLLSVGYFAEHVWCREGAFAWRDLPPGRFCIDGRLGVSGHGSPFFVLRNERTGEHVIGALAWSANWSVELTRDQLRGSDEEPVWFRIGPSAPPPQRVLAPGERVRTPSVHLGFVLKDLDGSIQAFHEHARRSVLLPRPEQRADRIDYNGWGYEGQEMSEESLFAEIDVAVDVGAETFIVDAGWYGDKNTDWWNTMGDWEVGNRLPRGLKPVADYARSQGLLFGLWMEPERLGSKSRVRAEHAEWLVRRDGQPVGAALDLANPQAAAWAEQQMIRKIEELELDLFRLDCGPRVREGGYNERHGYMESNLWRHCETLYGILDRLRARFPNLILENCAGGGGRNDLGMLSRFHYTQTSDWHVAPRSLRIVNGLTMALPPERIDRICGVAIDAHRFADLDWQMRSCLFSHMTISGVYPDKKLRIADQVERIRHYVELYKTWMCPFLSTCRVYHHTPVLPGPDGEGWCILEYVSADRQRAAAGLFRLAGPAAPEYRLKFRGLDEGKTYSLVFDGAGTIAHASGMALKSEGVTVRLDRPLSSELLLLDANTD